MVKTSYEKSLKLFHVRAAILITPKKVIHFRDNIVDTFRTLPSIYVKDVTIDCVYVIDYEKASS